MIDGNELSNQLRQFIGSEQVFYSPLNRSVLYTEGFKHFLQNAGNGAYWLLDILITQPEILKGVRDHGIVFIHLKVGNSQAKLYVNRDSGEAPLYERLIAFTDCPEAPSSIDDPKGEWLFYFAGNTIMLPSEY